MEPDYVYFDLETQRLSGDVGGWEYKDRMGMSIGVTYSTRTGKYRIYSEETVNDLINQLLRADLVIGYNHIHFDYEVLMGYTILDLKSQVRSLDLLVEIEQKTGNRPKLESVALASIGAGKTAEGTQAIRWWREGKIMEIARYCCFDVKVTKLVHEFGSANGHIKYQDRFGRLQRAQVDWPAPGPGVSPAPELSALAG